MPVRRDRNAPFVMRLVFGCAALAASATCLGGPLDLAYDSFRESKAAAVSLDTTSPIHIDGALRDAVSDSILNTLVFRAGSSALSLSAGWLVAPTSNRTVGVNIDLFDASNTLIASDLSLGSNGTQASSQLVATGLVAGATYHLLFTGTAVQIGRYQIDLVDGASPPPAVAPIPFATAASIPITFDTHVGDKTYGATIVAGDALRIEGDLSDDALTSVTNRFTFNFTGSSLSAGIEWIVAVGDQRTTGLNVDVFDATDTLVASDTFMGLMQGEAFSQFSAVGLGPGAYTMVLTANAPQRGRYRIDLSASGTAPGFDPISAAAVPEPAALLLMSVGALALLLTRRRSR